jgi:ribosomal protein S18 acetylase RimI-like enzyme
VAETSEPPVVIRRARPEDRDRLIELDLASARHHASLDPDLFAVPQRDAAAALVDRLRAEPERDVFVAVVNDAVIGKVDVAMEAPPNPGSVMRSVATADIGISVLEGWRGRGVGHALMAAAEAAARARGARRIVLDMSAANLGALRFYRSLGYAEYGLLLRRELSDTRE